MCFLPTDQTMFHGSFPYVVDKTFTFEVDAVIQGRISRIDRDVARIYFMRRDDQAAGNFVPAPVPGHLTLHDVDRRKVVPVHRNQLFITWMANYELRHGNEAVLCLKAEHQHAIRTSFDCGEFKN
jgi:hypothetical protein